METTGFLLHALTTSPTETLERLEKCCADSCDAVATDTSCFIGAFKLAHRQCGASVRTAAKSITALREGLRNVAAALDAMASLCASAMVSDDVEAVKAALEEGRRGRQLLLNLQAANDAVYHHWVSAELDAGVEVCEIADVGASESHLRQWVDVATLNDCQLVCEVNTCKPNRAACLPRGRHSFTLYASLRPKHWCWHGRSEGSDESELFTIFPLPPDEVVVNFHGDDTATWSCTRHPDGCGVVVDYTASPEPDRVEITVHVLGSAFYNQRMVNSYWHLLRLCLFGGALCCGICGA